MMFKALCLSLLLAAFASAEVHVLTTANFDTFVNEHELSLVEFYAPWCGHCKRLEPEYEKAADGLSGDNIPLAKVDATEEPDLASRFGVRGYPTLKIFRNGQDSEYGGGRTEADIVSYMRKQNGPASTVVDSVADAEKLVESDDVVVVFFHNNEETEVALWKTLTNKGRDDYKFGESSSKDVLAQYGVTSTPSIVLFKKFDDGKATFSGEWTEDAIFSFIKSESLPLVAEIGPSNFKNYHEAGFPLFWFFMDPSKDEHVSTYVPMLNEAAPAFKGKLSIVYLDGIKYKGVLSKMGLSEEAEDLPSMAIEEIAEDSDGMKYIFNEKIESASTISTFAQNFLDGKLEPFLKSEDIPEDNSGPVTTVVGKNFNDVVFADKDVLIEFYAPWCGHCKNLAPTWEKLGEHFKDVDTITIAQMDATANDTPKGFDVQGFPTIKFIAAGATEATEYNGGRDFDDFVKFLKTNAAKSLEGHDEL